MEEIIDTGLAELGLTHTTEIVDRFCRYGELLLEVNRTTNLTAIREADEVARLHFLDSAAIAPLADFSMACVADVGCGAGFPGLPLKLLYPNMRLTLLDSVGKKIDFCTQVVKELSLEGVDCRWGRVEEMPALRESFDIVTGRAVADLTMLAELCLPLARVGGIMLAMKGPRCEEEVAAAEFAIKALGGRVRDIVKYTIPGTDITHAVVRIDKIKPTPSQYPRRYAQMKKKPLLG